MDFCFNCGGKTDQDWVFCRACGSVLDDTETDQSAATGPPAASTPKIELISRGWDVVDVETVKLPADPLAGNEISPGPLPSGTIEISADDITVVNTDEEDAPADEPADESAAEPATPQDPWDHLRPHGEMPPLQHRVTIPARVSQVAALVAAVSALAAAAIHFFLNTRLDAFSDGLVSAGTVDDVELVADISLAVVAALILVAVAAVGLWLFRIRPMADARPGKAGLVALLSLLGGIGVVATSFAIKKETVTEAIAANSLIVLGLALVLTACLVTIRTVQRIELEDPT